MGERTHRIDYEKYIRELAEFMDDNGCKLRPFPRYRISNEKQNPLLGKTAYYDPETKQVTVFVHNRLLKDVLRSVAHENVHHHQNITGRLTDYRGDTLGQDSKLDELESEAYLKGNILFRKWTETKAKSERPEKPLTKHMKKKIEINDAGLNEEIGSPNTITIGNEVFKVNELEDYLKAKIEEILSDNYFDDVKIVGVKLIGSYMRGEQNVNSDIDVLVEYNGNAREDVLFNVLNDEENKIYINGVELYINPITPGKSGTISEFERRNSGFTKSNKNSDKYNIINEEIVKDTLREIINEMIMG